MEFAITWKIFRNFTKRNRQPHLFVYSKQTENRAISKTKIGKLNTIRNQP